MTPAQAIAALRRQLARHGQDIVLQRWSTGTGASLQEAVTARALVRPIGEAAELVGSVAQQDVLITLSPVEIIAAGWRGTTSAGAGDARIPIKGNKVIIAGRSRNIETVHPIYVANMLARINITARG
jgi:hypothetical protein